MGTHLSKHRGGGVTTTKSSPCSDVDKQRDRLRRAAATECTALAHSHNLQEVNLFFVPVPGVDFAEFVSLFSKATGFSVVEAAREDADLWSSVSRLETGWRKEAWDDPTAATKYLLAQQVENMTLTLPRPDRAPPVTTRLQGWPNVRIFTHSPVESRHINFPLFLQGRADAGLAELVNATTNLAWKMLQCQCCLGSSVWVYLKMNEDCWERLKNSHRVAHSNDDTTLHRWDTYRQQLNDFFSSHEFQKQHHTLTVEIHSQMLGEEDVINEVATIVAKFVAQQVEASMWDCNVEREEFRAHLASADYQQSNFVHARQAESFRALLGQLDRAQTTPVPSAHMQTLELIPSNASITSSLGRATSSRSPAGTLRRVDSGRSNSSSHSGRYS